MRLNDAHRRLAHQRQQDTVRATIHHFTGLQRLLMTGLPTRDVSRAGVPEPLGRRDIRFRAVLRSSRRGIGIRQGRRTEHSQHVADNKRLTRVRSPRSQTALTHRLPADPDAAKKLRMPFAVKARKSPCSVNNTENEKRRPENRAGVSGHALRATITRLRRSSRHRRRPGRWAAGRTWSCQSSQLPSRRPSRAGSLDRPGTGSGRSAWA